MKKVNVKTIAAISTPPGKGGIAVIRISGSDAIAIGDRMFKPKNGKDVYKRQLLATARHAACANLLESPTIKLLNEYPGSDLLENCLFSFSDKVPFILFEDVLLEEQTEE